MPRTTSRPRVARALARVLLTRAGALVVCSVSLVAVAAPTLSTEAVSFGTGADQVRSGHVVGTAGGGVERAAPAGTLVLESRSSTVSTTATTDSSPAASSSASGSSAETVLPEKASPQEQWAYFRAVDADRVRAARAEAVRAARVRWESGSGLHAPGSSGLEVQSTMALVSGGSAVGPGANQTPVVATGHVVRLGDLTSRNAPPRAESSRDDDQVHVVDTHPD